MIHHRSYPIGPLTTLGIGGVVDNLFMPESRAELLSILSEFHVRGQRYHLLGNGSNILVASKRIRKPIVAMKHALTEYRIGDDGDVYAESGVDIRLLINACAKKGLRAPVELLTIPATLGGAVVMNAGRTSYGVTISQSLVSVDVFDGQNEFSMDAGECRFGHRASIFQQRRDLTVLSAKLRYDPIATETLADFRKETLKAGADKCYRGRKSAGSVFKKCDWKLMEKLRGVRVGEAELAPNTPNCILNIGQATPLHVKTLIAIAKLAHRVKFKKCELEIEVW